MPHRIELRLKQNLSDPNGKRLLERVSRDLGIHLTDIRVADSFVIDRALSLEELKLISEDVFLDPVIQEVSVDEPVSLPYDWLIEVGFRPGVTDNVARTAKEAVQRTLGVEFSSDEGVYSRKLYFLSGQISQQTAERIARDLLANELIQTWTVYAPNADRSTITAPKVSTQSAIRVETIDLNVSDEELLRISREGVLALTLEEMKVVQRFFNDEKYIALRLASGLTAKVTDCELEAIAQTWSEHCKHKIFNAVIDYENQGEKTVIDSLFKSYIQRSTSEIRSRLGDNDFCLSVFKDNAGVIKLDEDWNLVVKVETHNSPSALDPYGGALTGIVGVNRDPFGTGMGSKLIFNTDVFCFAPPDYAGSIPPRLLHPRRVFEGVREGVEHGGNKSGIPTVNGAVVFDERYLGKPLVFCGTGGLMPREINGKPGHIKKASPGDRIIMVGGRIGKDGIHGATFSSEELHEGSPVSAVQIGDPITQKRMTDFLLLARDKGLYTSITDNGAGGLSSSVGEMATEAGGAKLWLNRAPLKYQGLQPWEILLSEAQERMTVATSADKVEAFLSLARTMDVEATDLGEFTNDGMFTVYWENQTVALLPLEFLHDGLPKMMLKARWQPPLHAKPEIPIETDLTPVLIKLLSRWNICSKESLIRQYDHEVQAGSVIKPLVGISNDGPGDAAVVRPVLDRHVGVAVGCGIVPRYSDLDTYHMMACAIDEAVRNIVCVGANPDRMAGLDNFCWCDPVQSPKTPDGEYKLAQLVRANQALYDLCNAYGIPCISGKDSMKNDYSIGDTKISIPPTVLFTAVGVVPDVRLCVTPDFKKPGDLIYVLGLTRNETGASEYFAMNGVIGNNVPKVTDPKDSIGMYKAVHRAINEGLLSSAHDLSDGGLAVALAECCFSGGLGAVISTSGMAVQDVERNDDALFSESPSRIVISVRPSQCGKVEEVFSDFTLSRVGHVTQTPELRIEGLDGVTVICANIFDLKKSWQSPLGV